MHAPLAFGDRRAVPRKAPWPFSQAVSLCSLLKVNSPVLHTAPGRIRHVLDGAIHAFAVCVEQIALPPKAVRLDESCQCAPRLREPLAYGASRTLLEHRDAMQDVCTIAHRELGSIRRRRSTLIGGEFDESADNSKLYTQPEDVLQAYEKLQPIGMFSVAASFGNVHGVYKPGNVKLRPEILKKSQDLVVEIVSPENSAPALIPASVSFVTAPITLLGRNEKGSKVWDLSSLCATLPKAASSSSGSQEVVLHLSDSGLPDDKIIELHGNTRRIRCMSCRRIMPLENVRERLATGESAPECDCGGYLKPDTISFGQSMPVAEVEKAVDLSRRSDFFLVVGSTLLVQPAAHMPIYAKDNGAFLAIVNRSDTPCDKMCDALIREKAGPVLQQIVAAVESGVD